MIIPYYSFQFCFTWKIVYFHYLFFILRQKNHWVSNSISTTLPRWRPRTHMPSRIEHGTVSIWVDTFHSTQVLGTIRRLWTKKCRLIRRVWCHIGPWFSVAAFIFLLLNCLLLLGHSDAPIRTTAQRQTLPYSQIDKKLSCRFEITEIDPLKRRRPLRLLRGSFGRLRVPCLRACKWVFAFIRLFVCIITVNLTVYLREC